MSNTSLSVRTHATSHTTAPAWDAAAPVKALAAELRRTVAQWGGSPAAADPTPVKSLAARLRRTVGLWELATQPLLGNDVWMPADSAVNIIDRFEECAHASSAVPFARRVIAIYVRSASKSAREGAIRYPGLHGSPEQRAAARAEDEKRRVAYLAAKAAYDAAYAAAMAMPTPAPAAPAVPRKPYVDLGRNRVAMRRVRGLS